jgi:hypothetical protein
MSILLQALRIPSGWLIRYNQFYEVDCNDEQEENNWMWFSEDLLQLVNEHWRRLLDLGWYPDGDIVNGLFRIMCMRVTIMASCCIRLIVVVEM